MDRCEKKSKGWHIAGLILTSLLLLIIASTFILGVCAFDTADYPAVGDTAIYPAGDSEILPNGAAAVASGTETPQRGMPAAYYDAEAEQIRIKYYYGEEDGKIILTNEQSEDVSEILPEQFRGVVQSYIPMVGYYLGWACTLGGVCISLAASILLCIAVIWISVSLSKVLKYNRRLSFAEADDMPAEKMITEEDLTEAVTAEGSAVCVCGCMMEPLREELDEAHRGMTFRGEAMDVLKLSKIFRTAAEKRSIASVTVDEQYGEVCELKVKYGQNDEAFVSSIIQMLKERNES